MIHTYFAGVQKTFRLYLKIIVQTFTTEWASWFSSFQEVTERRGAVQAQISSSPGSKPLEVSSGLSVDFHKVFANFSDIIVHTNYCVTHVANSDCVPSFSFKCFALLVYHPAALSYSLVVTLWNLSFCNCHDCMCVQHGENNK